MVRSPAETNFLVLSHLRWNFVFQRPQHLMTRCSRDNTVFFFEEPIFDSAEPSLEVRRAEARLNVVVPHLPAGLEQEEVWRAQQSLLSELLREYRIENYVAWYYTPMAMHFTRHLKPKAIVYDCMDELSAFRGAPPGLHAAEMELFAKADLIFTGGRSLYRSKQSQHHSVHCFPSSIDRDFFKTARQKLIIPADQAVIPQPRLGYCGVIDERLNIDLLAAIADLHPEWHLVMIGPIVKISASDLPQRSNIHYLGSKEYRELPSYLSGWDAGLMPFAKNESTRFISPTKTPEYLAAGLPVVSTSITDVVDPYGTMGLVHIADTAEDFAAAIELAIESRDSARRLTEVDDFLSQMSWDQTWDQMHELIEQSTGKQLTGITQSAARANIAFEPLVAQLTPELTSD
jgi:Glycosyltransferase